MPRYVYDAKQVRLLQREGQVVAAEEVDWSESTGLLSEEPAEGFVIVPQDRVAVNKNPPFRSKHDAEVELREIREWPEPTEEDAADEIPWPQLS
jgi:hypothetical protein